MKKLFYDLVQYNCVFKISFFRLTLKSIKINNNNEKFSIFGIRIIFEIYCVRVCVCEKK